MQYLKRKKVKKERGVQMAGKNGVEAVLAVVLIMTGCRSAGVPDAAADTAEIYEASGAETGYRFAGTSVVTVKPGTVRTVSVSYNSGETADETAYVWAVTDPQIVSIRGTGNRCVILGRREGKALVVVTNPDIPLPYAFEVVCSAEGAAARTFRRTRDERTEGRLTGGRSGLELAEEPAEEPGE
jgi:hypothetical protein